jgi:hypothetical protein
VYVYQRADGDDKEEYIRITDQNNNIYYIKKNNGTFVGSYVYSAKNEQSKVTRLYMGCLEVTLTTDKSKEYYHTLFLSNEDWISQIRRKLLGFNPEPFKGGKKRKTKRKTRKIKRTKRTLRNNKKNKKNKGTKKR